MIKVCGYIGPGDTCTFLEGHVGNHSWEGPTRTPKRISRDYMLMEIASVISRRGTCTRGRVGAVIAQDSRVVSTGYVGSPSGTTHCTDGDCIIGNHGGCTRTVHAEANAISFAARVGISTLDGTLYTTLSPCYDCAKLIINAGIERVVYHAAYRDSRGLDLLTEAGRKVEQMRMPENFDC